MRSLSPSGPAAVPSKLPLRIRLSPAVGCLPGRRTVSSRRVRRPPGLPPGLSRRGEGVTVTRPAGQVPQEGRTDRKKVVEELRDKDGLNRAYGVPVAGLRGPWLYFGPRGSA